MLAEEKGLDLVEIAAQAAPPVCRIMNSGKFFYQQSKREAEARKHQRHIQVKEVKFRPKIDEHDFQFKLRNTERFLKSGAKVKSVVIFRGREVVHAEIGRSILVRLAEELGEACNVESPPKREGNTMVQILSPKKDAAVTKKSDKGTKADKEPRAASKKAAKADQPEAAAKPKKTAKTAKTTSAEKAPRATKKKVEEPAGAAKTAE